MSLISILIGPAVGAVIGGLTNRLAIAMLFRPYQAHYMGKFRIPLTPGIIPKEKGNIATAIGNTVSQQLLDTESLAHQLLSDDMEQKISSSIDRFIHRLHHNPVTLQQFLLSHMEPEEYAHLTSQVEDSIVLAISRQLTNPTLGNQVSSLVVEQVMSKMRDSLLGRLGAGVLELMRDSVEHMLANNINQMLQNNAQQMVGDLVGSEFDQLLSKPIKEICEGKEELFAQFKSATMRSYRNLVETNLPKALAALNIQQIIEDKINAMDMRQTQKMLMQLMDKELKALVWFGVFLGFLMGFVTNII